MATVVSSLSLDRDTEVKPYLGISAGDTSEDTFLDLLMAGAKEAADNYMNNPFTDDDGVDIAIPSQVKLGVLNWISLGYEKRSPGLESEKAGDLSRTFSDMDDAAIEQLAMTYWWPYRLIPGT